MRLEEEEGDSAERRRGSLQSGELRQPPEGRVAERSEQRSECGGEKG